MQGPDAYPLLTLTNHSCKEILVEMHFKMVEMDCARETVDIVYKKVQTRDGRSKITWNVFNFDVYSHWKRTAKRVGTRRGLRIVCEMSNRQIAQLQEVLAAYSF